MISNRLFFEKTIAKSRATVFLVSFGFVFLFFFPSKAQQNTETIKFEIQVLGIKIGDLNASKYSKGDTLHYVAESQVKFWFFGSVNLLMKTHSKYLGGYLVKSKSTSNTNRGNFASTIVWDGKKYLVDAKSYKFENKEPVYGLVQWCSARMFFEELEEGKKFLSEVFGMATTIQKLEPNLYQTQVNGNENTYHYQQGKLQKVELENPIKDFTYKRIK